MSSSAPRALGSLYPVDSSETESEERRAHLSILRCAASSYIFELVNLKLNGPLPQWSMPHTQLTAVHASHLRSQRIESFLSRFMRCVACRCPARGVLSVGDERPRAHAMQRDAMADARGAGTTQEGTAYMYQCSMRDQLLERKDRVNKIENRASTFLGFLPSACDRGASLNLDHLRLPKLERLSVLLLPRSISDRHHG